MTNSFNETSKDWRGFYDDQTASNWFQPGDNQKIQIKNIEIAKSPAVS